MNGYPEKSGASSKSDHDLQIGESIQLRRRHIAESCQLHYTQSPLKIISSEGAYLIDDTGSKFLDCATRMSHVGHCHPCVVGAGRSVMQNVGALHSDSHHEQYVSAILKTLPSNFEVCLFTNSGSEANDLAIQLARNYTGKKAVAVMDHSFHGSCELLMNMCSKSFRRLPQGKPDWVTVIPLPDTYRGKYAQDVNAAKKYFEEAKNIINTGIITGGDLACFLSEPIFMVQGMVIPPPGWLANIYSYMKSLGALVISDEIQLGFGRCGSQFWGFQTQGVIPDILTVGKPMANGYPLSAVFTSRKIAEAFPNWNKQYKCESVAAAVGHSVLKALAEEELVERGLQSMDYLYNKLMELQSKHHFIGDVRKVGLIVGMEIVWNKESKKPDSSLAEKISYKLKDNNIIVANEGYMKNILVFMPPFCISIDDVDFLHASLSRIFSEFEIQNSSLIYDELIAQVPSTSTSGSSFMSQNNFLAEEQSSPEDCEYLYSDEEARREAEAYADMD